MKIAAIDIGSNSIHMVVVEARPGRDLRVLDREKDMVRLGDSAFRDGRLSASAQARALATIGRFLLLARRRGADAVLAGATSAVRSAENGQAFLALVRRHTGLPVSLLGDHEEARLIYLAVRDAVDLRGRPTLVLDVGGGSAELVVGDATAMRWAASLPVGVLRMSARFGGERPMSGKARRAARRWVREQIAPAVRAARRARVRQVVGTSGTVNAAARVLAAGGTGVADPESASVTRVPARGLERLAERLLAMPLRRRRKVPGLDPARADTLGLGCLLVAEVLRGVRADHILTCRAAVREGMALDYASTHPEARGARASHDVRERSVRDAAARYGDESGHGDQVSRLALALFDATRRLHRLGSADRELLHFGALLHDIGHHVEYRRHHRHSWYLVRNAELQGFEPDEVEVLACLCRYHRRAGPSDEHEEWRAVPRGRRRGVLALVGILRVADGLDRGHAKEVESLDVLVRPRVLRILVRGRGSVDLDILGAQGKRDVLEEALGRRVEFLAVPRAKARRAKRR